MVEKMKETILSIAKWHDGVIGKKFGLLKPLWLVDAKPVIYSNGAKYTKKHYFCECECGNVVIYEARSLKRGRCPSCGCLRGCINRTHGNTKTRLYSIWCNIKTRCCNKRTPKYKNYGGRGITICEEWQKSFQAFYDWAILNGYKDSLSIDRINNNKGYCPQNCRWTDAKTQSRNRTDNNKFLDICLTDWAEILCCKRQTLEKFVKRNGWELSIKHFKKKRNDNEKE